MGAYVRVFAPNILAALPSSPQPLPFQCRSGDLPFHTLLKLYKGSMRVAKFTEEGIVGNSI